MLRNILFLFIYLLALTASYGQTAIIHDGVNSLPYAHVINLTKNWGKLSDENGKIRMDSSFIHPGDSFQILYLGYKPCSGIWANAMDTIYMEAYDQLLNVVEVHSLHKKKRFYTNKGWRSVRYPLKPLKQFRFSLYLPEKIVRLESIKLPLAINSDSVKLRFTITDSIPDAQRYWDTIITNTAKGGIHKKIPLPVDQRFNTPVLTLEILQVYGEGENWLSGEMIENNRVCAVYGNSVNLSNGTTSIQWVMMPGWYPSFVVKYYY